MSSIEIVLGVLFSLMFVAGIIGYWSSTRAD